MSSSVPQMTDAEFIDQINQLSDKIKSAKQLIYNIEQTLKDMYSVPPMIPKFHNTTTIISNFDDMIDENLPNGDHTHLLKEFVKSEIIKNDSDENVEKLNNFITSVIKYCRS